ncbi:MAG TPA: NADH-quinone oxidoreductase subunit NuoG [Solirubrobacterales bacterium]|nr:NADH-quinone oxidoreductase subunit NuoG [Solirubrobacterales bacterium]
MSPGGKEITLIIDGREVAATEGEMLHDAAKRGDVEIPVFCYEPKLGEPVGACRMCLVEIEGIPKLQTSCSTPVRDGMVVHTRTDQVKHAQSAVVEFLLVNHPLDCPVCDKGGECPLQDISMGWGPGKSRMTDQKRHFEKPIELSPLVAIDRERCILCYRCVRFSQEVAEDEQLQLLERGDRTFVGTFDDRPYVAPFHGNITDLCPVGALTSYTYRFRARPWDVEQAGSVCTLCPSQCNVNFTVRDEQVKRVVARDNPDVDDGWLCDRGRYGFEMFNAEERIRAPRLRGGAEATWKEAIAKAAEALRAASVDHTGVGTNLAAASGGRAAAIVGDASNEEGYLIQRIMREALGSPNVDSRPSRGPSRETLVRLAQPEISAKVRDIDGADAILVVGTDPLHSSPILDLRIRKAIRRNAAKLAVATEGPTALDGGAVAVARYAPGTAGPFLAELAASLGADGQGVAGVLREAKSVVIVWGDRIGREGDGAIAALLDVASALDLTGKDGSGLLEVPELTNARGLREAGCLPDAGPGLTRAPFRSHTSPNGASDGKATEEIRAALESGELKTVLLFGVDPLRDFPDTEAWKKTLAAADHVIAFSTFETATTAMADVVFPLETHAEKDGTVTHPDGRLQRVRPSASRPGDIRPNWGVLAELSLALGHDTGIDSQPSAFAALTEAVPFYAGITDADIGGRGIRWQDAVAANPETGGPTGPDSADATRRGAGLVSTDAANASGSVSGESGPVGLTDLGSTSEPGSADTQARSASADPGSLVLSTYRDLWAGPITELNPPLRFLAPQQRVELSVPDADRLQLKQGDEVSVSQNGTSLRARVAIRERVPEGVCLLLEGTAESNANALLNGSPVSVRIEKTAAL